MTDPTELARRLSRSTGRRHSKLRFEGGAAFGGDLEVRSWRFGHGLRVKTLVDRSAPVVSYQTWLGVGSRHEAPGKTGLAHFFEHLMFSGTERFPHGELDRRLEEVGAESNAATWTDWTCYYENLPARELPLAITLEADRLTHLVLDPANVESEREVVLSERRDRVDDDVEGRASEALWSTLLGESPYGHPTIGWEADIRGYTVADCRAFHRTWYAPNNVTIVVAGDFEEDAVLARLQEAYRDLSPARLPDGPASSSRRPKRERRVELALPSSVERVLLGWPGPAFSDPDWVALAVLGELLFGGRHARIYRDLVLDRELASELYASIPPFALPSIFEVAIGARAGRPVERALEALDRHLERVCREPVQGDELEATKARLELSMLSALESAHGKGDQIGFFSQIMDEPAGSFRRLAAYQALTPADLLRAARRWLAPKGRAVVKVKPS
ncbi:MAG: insulinase family protein [Myxococcales bacterium]|nr:insulinase family protein [Myxococcales bacterium]